MANHTLFSGFETGDRASYQSVNGGARLVYDARNARTGDCYLALTDTALLTRVSMDLPTSTFGPTVDGNVVSAKLRSFFYLDILPSGTVTWTNAPAGNTDVTGAFSVYEEDGTLVETVTISGSYSDANFVGDTRAIPVPTLGGAGAITKRMRFDDVWYSVHGPGTTPSFPTAMRVTPVLATAQGSSAAWTGDWRLARAVPHISGGVAGWEQTTTGAGNTTTFAHKTASDLGVSGIEAVRIWSHHKRTGGTNVTHSMMWDGVAYPTTATQTAYAFGGIADSAHIFGSMSNSAFDAAEFGFRTDNGDSIQLGMIMIEVLHAGAGVPYASLLGDESFKLQIVQYTGDATQIREITGVGFRPSVVLIKMGADGGSTMGSVWIAGQGTASKSLDSNTWRSDKILSATADGFEISSDATVNASGGDFVAICMQDGGLHADGFFLKAGLYAPTGVDGWDEVIGMQPDFFMTCGGVVAVMRTTDNSGDESFQMSGTTQITNYIQAFNADGVEFGTDAAVGSASSSEFIPWIALRNADGVSLDALFKFGIVTGSGGSGTITGIPFTPHFVYAGKLANVAGRNFRVIGHPDHTGSNSSAWATGNLDTTTGILSMTSDGFTGGTNIFQSGVETQWFAFAESGEIDLPEPPTDFEFPPGKDVAGKMIGLTWVEFAFQVPD